MTSPLELWLVRHGESTYNAEGRYAGWSDPDLTEAGEAMAVSLQPRLEGTAFGSVWRSDRTRTERTAKLAGFPNALIDARLREIHFGGLEGLTYEEAGEDWRLRLRSFDEFSAPDGESIQDLRARVTAFLDELPTGRHLIFSHGGWIRCVMAACGDSCFPDKAELVRIDWPSRKVLG